MTDAPRYHIELKSFPHISRAFNLDRVTVDTRFVKPWTAGEMIEYDERRWRPEKTKITVLEGPEVSSVGLGRGWGEVTRQARDVTDAVIAEVHRGADARPEVEALKAAIAELDELDLPDVVALAVAAQPLWRASEQLSLAEQAVWEMLHQGGLEMLDGDSAPIAREGWQPVILSWGTWAGAHGAAIRLRSPRP